MKQITILLLLLFVILLRTGTGMTTAEEGSIDTTLSIALVDVYTGSNKEESGCIFDVNGQTAVVNYHDTETVNGVTIYVQEVYAVNTEAKDKDNCAFLYYVIGEKDEELSGELEVDELMNLNIEIIADEEVEFILTSREQYETLVEETSKSQSVEVDEAPLEETVVKVNGITVTEEKTAEQSTLKETTEQSETEGLGFFARLWRFLFE